MPSRKSKRTSSAGGAPTRRPERGIWYAARAAQDRDWLKANQPAAFERFERLLADIRRTPHEGLGKPEPLRFRWSGWWSRRITREHRLVYKVEAGTLYIAQCRYHYGK
jgi:toxin YoeB